MAVCICDGDLLLIVEHGRLLTEDSASVRHRLHMVTSALVVQGVLGNAVIVVVDFDDDRFSSVAIRYVTAQGHVCRRGDGVGGSQCEGEHYPLERRSHVAAARQNEQEERVGETIIVDVGRCTK